MVRDLIFRNKTLNLYESVSAGEVQSALVIDFANLDNNLIADSDNILNSLCALDIEVADVDKTLLAGSNLDKRAEVHQTGDNPCK